MNRNRSIQTVILIGCCLLFGGCDEFKQQLASLQRGAHKIEVDESSLPPITVTFAPAKNWLPAAIKLTQSSSNLLSDEEAANAFPGLDVTRPAGAVFYFSQKGSLQPIVLVPVTDYETLLDQIARIVPLRRAYASSFEFLGARCKIKQYGDYAAFSMSSKIMDRVPDDVSLVLGQLDERHDVAMEVYRNRLPEGWNDKLSGALESWIPCRSLEAVEIVERMTVGMSFSDSLGVPFEMKLSPVKTENSDAIAKLTEFFSEQIGAEVTSQCSEIAIHWQFKLPEAVLREQIGLAHLKIEESVRSRESAFAHLQKFGTSGLAFDPSSVGGGTPSGGTTRRRS